MYACMLVSVCAWVYVCVCVCVCVCNFSEKIVLGKRQKQIERFKKETSEKEKARERRKINRET